LLTRTSPIRWQFDGCFPRKTFVTLELEGDIQPVRIPYSLFFFLIYCVCWFSGANRFVVLILRFRKELTRRARSNAAHFVLARVTTLNRLGASFFDTGAKEQRHVYLGIATVLDSPISEAACSYSGGRRVRATGGARKAKPATALCKAMADLRTRDGQAQKEEAKEGEEGGTIRRRHRWQWVLQTAS